MTRIASQDAPADMVGITAADELVVHGPPRQVAGDAPPLDLVVALAGRDPAWPAG